MNRKAKEININLENADTAFNLMLNKKFTKKVSINQICKSLYISPSTFKRVFGSLHNFYFEYLKDQIMRYHQFNPSFDYRDNMRKTLEIIQKRAVYYQVIYEQTSRQQHIEYKNELIYYFKDVIFRYAVFCHGIGNRAIDRIAEGIYSHILAWILHDCQNSIEEIMDILEAYFAEIEGHRCSLRKI